MKNRPGLTIALVLFAIVATLLGLGTYQNHTRMTQLSFDYGFGATQLQDPISVPLLMWVCFGTGFLLSAIYFGGSSFSANAKARRLEQQLAMTGGSSTGGSSDDGWR